MSVSVSQLYEYNTTLKISFHKSSTYYRRRIAFTALKRSLSKKKSFHPLTYHTSRWVHLLLTMSPARRENLNDNCEIYAREGRNAGALSRIVCLAGNDNVWGWCIPPKLIDDFHYRRQAKVLGEMYGRPMYGGINNVFYVAKIYEESGLLCRLR